MDHHDLTTAPTCWTCRQIADVVWWTTVVARGTRIYRPMCSDCSPIDHRPHRMTTCAVCSWPLGYATPPPPGKGQWIEALGDVCGWPCLDQLRARTRKPPPPPRPCRWCAEEFQPDRRHPRATYCSGRCRKAASRHRRSVDPAEVLELIDLHDRLPEKASRRAAELLDRASHRTP